MGWLKKGWKKLKEFATSVKEGLEDFFNGVLSGFDYLFGVVGFMPPKKLRLRIMILKDNNTPVQNVPAVEQWLSETKNIFEDKMNIVIRKAGEEFIEVIQENAPDYALNPTCDTSFIYSSASNYFTEKADRPFSGPSDIFTHFTGYRKEIVVFVVKSLSNESKSGCSFPILYNFCLLDNACKTTSLAHEIGHMSWLKDRRDGSNNLMNPQRDDMDSKLTKWQKTKIRASKYVTYV